MITQFELFSNLLSLNCPLFYVNIALMNERKDNLNGLRILAMLLIYIYHVYSWRYGSNHVLNYMKIYGGYMGNSVFFCLSGYLISSSCRTMIADRSLSFRSYIVRRFLRLYPMFLITNLINLCGTLALHGTEAFDLKRTVFSILMLNGGVIDAGAPWSVSGWFACVLFFCYVVYFLLARLAKNEKLFIALCGIIFIEGLDIMLLDTGLPLLHEGLYEGVAPFFAGCFIASAGGKKKLCAITALILGTAAVLLTFLFFRSNREWIYMQLMNVGCAGPLILMAALWIKPLSAFLSLPPLAGAGTLSGMLFFWQGIYFGFWNELVLKRMDLKNRGIIFILFFALCLGAAAVTGFLWKKFTAPMAARLKKGNDK